MTKPSSKSGSKPLVLTPGEPAGIGPDLVLRLALGPRKRPWVVVADKDLLCARAEQLCVSIRFSDDGGGSDQPGELAVRHVPLAEPASAGHLDPRNAHSVLRTLEIAVDGCLAGAYAGLVTGPIQKSVMNDGGIAFSGHTEFLQARSGVDDVVMLLVAGDLRVALATTHLPLKDVAGAIDRTLLSRRLEILHRGLVEHFGLTDPRILLAGLNPHAGEGGHLGREEIEVFEPVAETLRSRGWQIEGPLPADTLFTPAVLARGDAVMAAYHDQGLPVLKHVGFGHAVNVTLGLPFVRTSVDHGTALDLAGSAAADVGSMLAAIELAERMTA